jgi:cell division protease FtsH
MSDQEQNEPQEPESQSQDSQDSDGQEAAGQEPYRDRFWQGVSVPDLVKQRIDVIKAQQSSGRKLLMALRKFYAILPIAVAVYFFLTNPTFQNTVLAILQFVAQLLFAIAYAIIQFVAIFWFMSRSKVEKVRPTDPKSITFDDYWGQPRLKRLVRQWLGLLSDRQQFVEMGGRYINGLLLYGPPGTGKTMLAKAMAGEAGVAFISIEGSGFRAMFWGVDVMKMIWFIRKARKLAQRYGAAIAYIDEIDAVAQSRGGVMGGGDGAGGGGGGGMGGMMGGGSGALTRLLYEMDGIDSKTLKEKLKGKLFHIMGKKPPDRNWHVLFMGSTNRPDVIDPALKRPGRFDQLIKVDLPDRTGRREIVEGYLRTVNHDDSVDVESIVMNNRAATPAQIMAAITKDAVRVALFDHRNAVSQQDIEKAFLQQYTGIENPIEEMEERQRWEVAVHEAGHAVAQHYLMPDTRIAHITIVRRGDALGFVLPMDEVEMYSQPLSRIVRDMMVCLAGQAAMRVVLGESFTGASGGDYPMVRERLWRLYNEGYFGPPVVDWRTGRDSTGGAVADRDAQAALRRMWVDLQDRTERLLRDHQAELIELAENLVEHNSLSTKQVVAILGPNKPENPPELLPPPPVRPEPPAVAASATARTAEERSHDLPDETAAR